MDRRIRIKIIIASVIAALVAAIVVIAVIGDGAGGGGSDPSSFVTFLPIWIAIFVPIFVARQRQEKAKRRFSTEDEDIYTMMNRLVDDLDDDEMGYLKQQLNDKFGDTLGGHS